MRVQEDDAEEVLDVVADEDGADVGVEGGGGGEGVEGGFGGGEGGERGVVVGGVWEECGCHFGGFGVCRARMMMFCMFLVVVDCDW